LSGYNLCDPISLGHTAVGQTVDQGRQNADHLQKSRDQTGNCVCARQTSTDFHFAVVLSDWGLKNNNNNEKIVQIR
jgi:hypothetical protein